MDFSSGGGVVRGRRGQHRMSQHVSQSGAAIFCGWVSVLISSGSPRVLRQLRARMGHARGVPNEIELAAANRSVFPTTLQVHGVCANRTGWGAGTVARRERTWGAQQWPPRWHAGRAPHLARAPATVPWRTGSGCPPRAGAGPFNSNPMGVDTTLPGRLNVHPNGACV